MYVFGTIYVPIHHVPTTRHSTVKTIMHVYWRGGSTTPGFLIEKSLLYVILCQIRMTLGHTVQWFRHILGVKSLHIEEHSSKNIATIIQECTQTFTCTLITMMRTTKEYRKYVSYPTLCSYVFPSGHWSGIRLADGVLIQTLSDPRGLKPKSLRSNQRQQNLTMIFHCITRHVWKGPFNKSCNNSNPPAKKNRNTYKNN